MANMSTGVLSDLQITYSVPVYSLTFVSNLCIKVKSYVVFNITIQFILYSMDLSNTSFSLNPTPMLVNDLLHRDLN